MLPTVRLRKDIHGINARDKIPSRDHSMRTVGTVFVIAIFWVFSWTIFNSTYMITYAFLCGFIESSATKHILTKTIVILGPIISTLSTLLIPSIRENVFGWFKGLHAFGNKKSWAVVGAISAIACLILGFCLASQ